MKTLRVEGSRVHLLAFSAESPERSKLLAAREELEATLILAASGVRRAGSRIHSLHRGTDRR